MLDSERLEEVLDKVSGIISLANRKGELETLLESWGLNDLIESDYSSSDDYFDTYKDGKILVVGASQVKEINLLGIVKALDIKKDRIEFCLGYNKAAGYPFNKLRYNPKYRLIIAGPIPHSTEFKGNSSSVIAEMEKGNGYPRVIRLGSNELKITKSNFREALQKQLDDGYI